MSGDPVISRRTRFPPLPRQTLIQIPAGSRNAHHPRLSQTLPEVGAAIGLERSSRQTVQLAEAVARWCRVATDNHFGPFTREACTPLGCVRRSRVWASVNPPPSCHTLPAHAPHGKTFGAYLALCNLPKPQVIRKQWVTVHASHVANVNVVSSDLIGGTGEANVRSPRLVQIILHLRKSCWRYRRRLRPGQPSSSARGGTVPSCLSTVAHRGPRRYECPSLGRYRPIDGCSPVR